MLAGATGLEPATSAVTGQRSNQLSYAPAMGDAKLRKPPPTRQQPNCRAAHGCTLALARENFHRAYCNRTTRFYSARQLNREK